MGMSSQKSFSINSPDVERVCLNQEIFISFSQHHHLCTSADTKYGELDSFSRHSFGELDDMFCNTSVTWVTDICVTTRKNEPVQFVKKTLKICARDVLERKEFHVFENEWSAHLEGGKGWIHPCPPPVTFKCALEIASEMASYTTF